MSKSLLRVSPDSQAAPASPPAPARARRALSKPAMAAIVLVALALLLPVALPWIKTPVIIAGCFGIAALGVSVLIRAGQMSFGHAMFSCAAGYAVAFAARSWAHLDSTVLIALGTVVGALSGALIGAFVVRYRAIFFGMLNLALSMVLFAVLGKFFNLTGGTDGMRLARSTFLGMHLERDGFETALLVTVVLLAVVLGMLVQRYLTRSAGQALSAIKTNETRLEFLGISAYRVLLTGYVLSAALCGLSGAIFAMTQGLVTPEMGYWVRSGEIVFIAILGGVGHRGRRFPRRGRLRVRQGVRRRLSHRRLQLVLGVMLIVMVFFAPRGISGLLRPSQARRQAMSAPLLQTTRPDAVVRRRGGRRRHQLRAARRRAAGRDRPERRRQDHLHQHLHRLDPAHQRPGALRRPRHHRPWRRAPSCGAGWRARSSCRSCSSNTRCANA